MTVARLVRRALAAAIVSAVTLAAAAAEKPSGKPADVPAQKVAVKAALPKWETARATSPQSADELKALQARVKEVAQKATAATVCLYVEPAVGSGVIVSDDGLVLTAGHVTGKPRTKLKFILSDGTVVNGIALGLNERADSGMAKITDPPPKDAPWPGAKEGKWPVAELGKADALATGQWLVALGHPNGLKRERPPVVRVGRYLSNERHEVPLGSKHFESFLQSNCTIVGGDSGGPLFDLDGKLVGIHSQIGMIALDQNYHVPVEKFRAEWARLLRGDAVGRDPTVVMNLVFDEDAKEGLKVAEVREGGAAERAGVEVGDVFRTLAGNPVKTRNDVHEILSSYATGDKVKIEVKRGDESKTLELKLTRKTTR